LEGAYPNKIGAASMQFQYWNSIRITLLCNVNQRPVWSQKIYSKSPVI